MTELPNCFGVAWDEPGVDDCAGCGVKGKCKVKFVDSVLWGKVVNNPDGVNINALGSELGVSPAAISAGIAEVKAIQAEAKEEEASPPPVKRESVKKNPTPKKQATTEERPIPAKKRRGRKPANLVVCDTCNGTGWVGDELCSVCGGYGDHSFPVETNKEKKPSRKAAKPVDPETDTGDGSGKAVEGGDSPSNGETRSLPVQGEEVRDSVRGSTGDSGDKGKAKAKTGPKASKGDKEDPGLVGFPLLSAQQLVERMKLVEHLSVDHIGRRVSITFTI